MRARSATRARPIGAAVRRRRAHRPSSSPSPSVRREAVQPGATMRALRRRPQPRRPVRRTAERCDPWLYEPPDEREGGLGHLAPTGVDGERVAPPSIVAISVTPSFLDSFLYAAFAIANGTVWSRSPATISIGPRRGFFQSTFASVHGLMFADAD